MTFYATYTTLTIDGRKFEYFDSIECEEPSYGMDLRPLVRPAPVELSVEVPLAVSPEELAGFFHREPVGASVSTLARRVAYGGRKGRSALRRLRARSIPIEMQTGGPWPTTLRGKAVVLDVDRLFVEMREVR